jgi:hypothetical protein
LTTAIQPLSHDTGISAWQAAVAAFYPAPVRLIPLTQLPPPGIPVASPGQQLIGDVGLWVNGVLGYSYPLTRNGLQFQTGPWSGGPLYTLQNSDVGDVAAR